TGKKAHIPHRPLTMEELASLDALFDLYRREHDQTWCVSTEGRRTSIRENSRGASEQFETDGCIEFDYVDEGVNTEIRTRQGILRLGVLASGGWEEREDGAR